MNKQKKIAGTVVVDSVKVDLNDFPDNYMKNIAFENCDIIIEPKKKYLLILKFIAARDN